MTDDRMTARRYYECHVTCLGWPGVVRLPVEELGWTFSAIDGDPDLGAGVKCYATRQFNERIGTEAAIMEVSEAGRKLRAMGVIVTREKVEHVIYDRRNQ
jgi:hypothetical protein